MPYAPAKNRSKRKARRPIDLRQNKFSKGYISTIDNSRRPMDSLSDMTNMELVEDNIPRPRPPLTEFGTQPSLTVIGRGEFKYNGSRYLLWAMDDSGTGKLYKQIDGGSYTVYADADNSYTSTADWLSCVQSKSYAYVYNGVDRLSYINLVDDTITKYTALSTPVMTSATYTGTAGTETHYYKVAAYGASGGLTAASTAVSDNLARARNAWVENSDYIDVVWGSVASATGYTVFYSSDNITFYELYSTTATSFRDLGTIAPNPYNLAPDFDASAGQIFTYMYSDTKNGQIFGVTADNQLHWSAPGNVPGSAKFSPDLGGGWVPIDEDGDTELNYVTGYRNGKGDPVITVSARGAAGKGKLYHVSFDSLTVGDQVIIYPNVYEANGQSGTYAPRATIKSGDDLVYPTGRDFKSTGTSQNIVNILTTRSISQVINDNDVINISLSDLHKAVGVEDQDRLYFALPVGSTENNQIWYLDRARKNAWILRWTVSAKDMWLYEDSDGMTHFCVLSNNKVLEFTRAGATLHQDDGVPFRSRVAYDSLVWDDGGYSLGKIRRQYVKLLDPRGTIVANSTGLSRRGATVATGTDTFTTTTTLTGVGQWQYGDAFNLSEAAWSYGDDPGSIDTYGKSVAMLQIKPKGLLAEESWEVVAETAGTDYRLSGVRTKGTALDDLVLNTN